MNSWLRLNVARLGRMGSLWGGIVFGLNGLCLGLSGSFGQDDNLSSDTKYDG